MSKIKIEHLEKGSVIRPVGNLMSNDDADDFKKITEEISDLEYRNLIIDFSETALLGSLLIGLLVRTQAHYDKKDGRIAFCNFPKPVLDVLKMTRVNTIINMYDDLEDAKRILK